MNYDFYDGFDGFEDYKDYEDNYRAEDEIESREAELQAAVCDMLESFLIGADEVDFEDGFDEMGEFFKDMICEQLYLKFGVSVYRPMYLENETEELEYEEFPYEEMAFDGLSR